MALVHWDKSVLTFHLREMIEDHNKGKTHSLIGLGAILLGTSVLPSAVKLGRPILKKAIKSGIYLYEESKSSFNTPKNNAYSSLKPNNLNRVNHNSPMKTPVEFNN